MIIKALWITLVTILVVSVAAEAKSVGDRSPLIPDALLVHYGGLNVGEKFSYGLVSLKDPSYQRSLWSKPPIQRASNFVITAVRFHTLYPPQKAKPLLTSHDMLNTEWYNVLSR
jgi:hypothetical protein